MIKHLIKILISLTLLSYLFIKYDIVHVFNDIIKLGLLPLIIVLFTLLMQQISNVHIKQTMLNIFQYSVKKWTLFKMLFIGNLYGSILPSVIGGDAYYIYFLGRKFDDSGRVAFGVVLIKSIGISVFLLLGFVTILMNYSFFIETFTGLTINFSFAFLAVLLLLIVIIGLLFLLREKWMWINKIALKGLLILKEIKQSPWLVGKIFLFTLFFYIFSIGGRVLLALSTGINIDTTLIVFVIILINLIILVPISISGIGVREMLYVLFLTKLGVSSQHAIMIAMLDFSITILSWIIGGVLLIVKNKNT